MSAADARLNAPDRKADLDFDAQTRVLHYAMLAGSEGHGFSATRASAVVGRMNDLQEQIVGNSWKELIAPCDRAYPAVHKTSGIALPKSAFDAELGCYSLGDFLEKTVSSTDPRTQDRFAALETMKHELDGPIGSALKARGADKAQALKQAALAGMTRLGAPAAVMSICTGRFA